MVFWTYTYFLLASALTKIGALIMVIGLTFGQEKKVFGQVRLFRNQRYYPCFGLHQANLAVIFCFCYIPKFLPFIQIKVKMCQSEQLAYG